MNDEVLRTADQLVDELLAQAPALVTYEELAEYKRRMRHLIAEARADELTHTHIEGFLKHNCGSHAISVYIDGKIYPKEDRIAALTNKPKQKD